MGGSALSLPNPKNLKRCAAMAKKPPRHAEGVPPSCRRPSGATGRVGFGAAALRALIPRPRINHRSGQRIGHDISKRHAPNLPAMR